MKFTTTATTLSTLAMTAMSSPTPQTPAPEPVVAGTRFHVMALRSASPIHFANLQAANNSLLVGAPSQNASCGPETPNYATFYVTEENELFLNTANPPQQFFVDRSGMGQGVIQYTTGAQGIPKNAERTGFRIGETGDLVFGEGESEQGFVACPGALGGGYSVWLAGATNPGGNEGCLGFAARAVEAVKPVECSYTQYAA